jgi:integrase
VDKSGHATESVEDTVRFIVKKRYTDLKGRRREKKRIAYSLAGATRAMGEIAREIEDELTGTARPDHTRTVSDVITHCKQHQFKPAVYAGGIKVAGQRTWRATWNALKPVEKYFGKMAIVRVTHDDFEDYKEMRLRTPVVINRVRYEMRNTEKVRVEYVETRPRSITSVNRELSWAHRVFAVALNKKWIVDHPFGQGDPLIKTSLENKHLRILSFGEERELFGAFNLDGKRKHLPFAVTFALETGMRKIEQFANLDRERDVDIDGRLLWATSYKGNKMIRRPVPITDLLLPQLVAHLASHKGKRVFEILDPKKAFGRSCADAGIAGVTWHSLRHTAITRMVHVYKIPPMDVMAIVGHTNWKTFQGTYVNLDADMVRSIGAAIDAARAAAVALRIGSIDNLAPEVPQYEN